MVSSDVVELLKTSIVFLDMDGTLTEYRYNNHVSAGDGTNNGQTVEEINNHIFLQARPLVSVIDVITNCCRRDYTYVLGHLRSEGEGLIYGIEEMDKKEWIGKNVPFINPDHVRFLHDYESKAEKIKKLSNRFGTKRVVLVDDKIDILREVEQLGFIALHVTSLIN